MLSGNALIFTTVFSLTLALFMIIAGFFTCYFGSGKSTKIGVLLFVIGAIIGGLIGMAYQQDWVATQYDLWPIVKDALVVLIAAVLGALIAIGLFLVAIMKT